MGMVKEQELIELCYTQSVIRSSIVNPLSCYQFTFLFNHFEMSKDFLRQLFYKMDEQERKDFEKDILSAATIIRVLSTEYLQNAVLFIQNDMVQFFKERLKEMHALQKFKYRLEYKLHPEKFESVNYYIDGSEEFILKNNSGLINNVVTFY